MSREYTKRRPSEKFRVPVDEQGNVMIPLDHEGKPDYGAVMRYFRLFVKEWSASYLAIRYAEALKEQGEEEDETVTARWIQIMEKENKVPTDHKRRWILATLLSIPGASFGLKRLNQPPKSLLNTVQLLLQKEWVDIAEYKSTLARYCSSYNFGESDEIIQDIRRRIDILYKTVHLTSSPEKEEMLRLLCDYYILSADIAHEYQCFNEAIALLNIAVFIARENNFYTHLAHILRQRGNVHSERGEITALLHGFTAAQYDFDEAAKSFDEILSIEDNLSPQGRGAIYGVAGKIYASVARDRKEHTKSLKKVDVAIHVIGQQDSDITSALILDAERCHLDKAAALLASPIKSLCFPELAREKELIQASKQATPHFKIRQAYNAFLQAKSYFMGEEYEMAATYTELAIPITKQAQASIHLTRLDALYQGLLKSPIGKSDAVSELGISLLKAQQPQLFH